MSNTGPTGITNISLLDGMNIFFLYNLRETGKSTKYTTYNLLNANK